MNNDFMPTSLANEVKNSIGYASSMKTCVHCMFCFENSGIQHKTSPAKFFFYKVKYLS